jgi:hypothetical protein
VNTKRDWTKVTLIVVLALTSLSSVALTVPHSDGLTAYAADVCAESVEINVGFFDQYLAAIDWAERGETALPVALTVNCVEAIVNLAASSADLGGESLARHEQYQAALAPSFGATWLNATRVEQYLDAIAEPVPAELVSNLAPLIVDDDGVKRHEQYQAALAPSFGATWLNATRVQQYLDAIK